MKRSKRYREAEKLRDEDKIYSVEEAIDILKQQPQPKFNESVDVSIKLGVDPRKSDQMVRGSSKLPHGTGKTVRVLVFCEPEKEQSAKEAGDDFVGSGELIEKISKGWTDFDYCIATPSIMRNVSRLGKTLGPRGLMPSPKSGTVTENIKQAVKEAKEGMLHFKMNKFASLNVGAGRASFTAQQLVENVTTFLSALVHAKPQTAKGTYIKSITLSTTMGVGLRVDLPKHLQL